MQRRCQISEDWHTPLSLQDFGRDLRKVIVWIRGLDVLYEKGDIASGFVLSEIFKLACLLIASP
jgi:hypothetical protein